MLSSEAGLWLSFEGGSGLYGPDGETLYGLAGLPWVTPLSATHVAVTRAPATTGSSSAPNFETTFLNTDTNELGPWVRTDAAPTRFDCDGRIAGWKTRGLHSADAVNEVYLRSPPATATAAWIANSRGRGSEPILSEGGSVLFLRSTVGAVEAAQTGRQGTRVTIADGAGQITHQLALDGIGLGRTRGQPVLASDGVVYMTAIAERVPPPPDGDPLVDEAVVVAIQTPLAPLRLGWGQSGGSPGRRRATQGR